MFTYFECVRNYRNICQTKENLTGFHAITQFHCNTVVHDSRDQSFHVITFLSSSQEVCFVICKGIIYISIQSLKERTASWSQSAVNDWPTETWMYSFCYNGLVYSHKWNPPVKPLVGSWFVG